MNDLFENPMYQAAIRQHIREIDVFRLMNRKEAYLEIRERVKMITDSENFKNAITCGKGTGDCSFCCHDVIQMGKAETEFIKKVVKEKKIIPNQERLKKQNQNQNLPLKWADKACPMLLDENENGQRLCSIYEDRPLICIAHNSAEDPQRCNKDGDPKRSIREAKVAILDAHLFTAFHLGVTHKKDVPGTLKNLHEVLYEMNL